MNRRNILLFTGLAILLFAATFAGYRIFTSRSTASNEAVEFEATAENPANLAPPTEADEQQVDEFKKQLKENQQNEEGSAPEDLSSNSTEITPIITRFDQQGSTVYVRAFAQSKAQGTCTLLLTKSGQSTIMKTSDSEFQGSYYQCEGFTFNDSELPSKGEWQAVIEFENSNEKGRSEPTSYEIK